MPGYGKQLIQMCQGAAGDAKIHIPNSIIGNPDSDAQLLLRCAQRAIDDLMTRNNGHWTDLVSEHLFDTNVTSIDGTVTAGSPFITGVPDTSSILVGIYTYTGGLFPNNSMITLVTPGTPTSTVRLSYPATASGPGPHQFSQSGYPLPADFDSFVDGTMWDRSRFWAMRGPLTPQQWQLYKSSVIGKATLQRRWRVMNVNVPGAAGGGPLSPYQNYLFIDPTPGAGPAHLVFEYNSVAPIMSADGVSQTLWLHDDDLPKLDGRVVELGIKARLLDRLGQDFSTALDEYERRCDIAIAKDGGAGILDVAPNQDLGLLNWTNIPETGYGPPQG